MPLPPPSIEIKKSFENKSIKIGIFAQIRDKGKKNSASRKMAGLSEQVRKTVKINWTRTKKKKLRRKIGK